MEPGDPKSGCKGIYRGRELIKKIMADFAVNTAFNAKGDSIINFFNRAGKGASRFGKQTDKAFSRASKSASNFRTITKSILAAGAVQRGLGLFQQGIGAVAREFVGFDDAITASSAKFKGLNLATVEGQRILKALKKTARDVGAATQFSATEAAQGLDFLAMAGFNASQSMAALPGVVDLATVGNVDLARSTDIASDSLGAFGLMTKNANQLQVNFTRLNDVMAKTMTATNTSLEDMFEAVKKGAPTFTSAGQSLESFSALAGVMANSGVKGAEAGTQLRNVMLRLADPTKSASAVLDKLNIKTTDSQGNFRDVIDILGDFEKGLKGMGTQQRAAALSTVFGARAVTGINLLLQEGTGALRKFRGELENAGGTSKQMANIMRKSLGNRLKSLQSAAIELGFKFFEAFEKQGGKAIDKLTKALRKFDPKPIIDGIKTAVKVFKTLFSIIQSVSFIMPPLIAGFIAYNAVLKAQAAFQAAQTMFALMKALRGATIAQTLLNLAMLANPIGLIIAGVAALIALLVVLQKKFDIIGKAKAFFGIGDAEVKAKEQKRATPEAPNAEQARARAQNVDVSGLINIAGAPPGSTVERGKKSAPGVDMQLLGANP